MLIDSKKALSKLLDIPTIKAVVGESVDQYSYLLDLLELSSGKNQEGVKTYRIYKAAADYLGQHPDLMLKKHDGSELGDIPYIIENLLKLQAAEDDILNISSKVESINSGSKGVNSFVGFTPSYPIAHWERRGKKKLR